MVRVPVAPTTFELLSETERIRVHGDENSRVESLLSFSCTLALASTWFWTEPYEANCQLKMSWSALRPPVPAVKPTKAAFPVRA